MRSIDIAPADLETVRRILREHTPELEVRAFGSRVSWTARATSDLDLALMTDEPLSTARMAELKAAFTKSDLPFRVDVVDWASTSESFREVIERDYVVLAASDGEPFDGSNSGMADGWQTVTVADIAEKVAMGPFGSSIKVNTFVPEGVPVISGQHLHGIRVDDAPGFNFVTPEHAERLANANVRRGDIVFTHAGNIGQVAYIPEDSRFDRYVISQRQFYMRCDRAKVIPEFVAMYFTSPAGQHQLLANASQVGVPSIAQPVTYLRTVEIPLPPLPEQRAIAHVLGTLDDKIELNRRMSETLEAMARALFKSWFVDFDPVRAKMAGRDTGLPQDIADLFPDRMVDSELGEIPEGWENSTIGEEVAVVGGSTPSTKDRSLWDGEINWATPKDLSALSAPVLLETGRQISDAGLNKISSGLLPQGVVLLSSRAPIGYLAIAEIPVAVNQGFIAMRCESRLSNVFVWLWTLANMDTILQNANGSTFQEISKRNFRPLGVTIPVPDILSAFDECVRPLYKHIVKNQRESRTLATLRDTLLSNLISGELRVKGAKRLIGRTA